MNMMCIGPTMCTTADGQCCALLFDTDLGGFVCPLSCQAKIVHIYTGQQSIANNNSTTNMVIYVSDGALV